MASSLITHKRVGAESSDADFLADGAAAPKQKKKRKYYGNYHKERVTIKAWKAFTPEEFHKRGPGNTSLKLTHARNLLTRLQHEIYCGRIASALRILSLLCREYSHLRSPLAEAGFELLRSTPGGEAHIERFGMRMARLDKTNRTRWLLTTATACLRRRERRATAAGSTNGRVSTDAGVATGALSHADMAERVHAALEVLQSATHGCDASASCDHDGDVHGHIGLLLHAMLSDASVSEQASRVGCVAAQQVGVGLEQLSTLDSMPFEISPSIWLEEGSRRAQQPENEQGERAAMVSAEADASCPLADGTLTDEVAAQSARDPAATLAATERQHRKEERQLQSSQSLGAVGRKGRPSKSDQVCRDEQGSDELLAGSGGSVHPPTWPMVADAEGVRTGEALGPVPSVGTMVPGLQSAQLPTDEERADVAAGGDGGEDEVGAMVDEDGEEDEEDEDEGDEDDSSSSEAEVAGHGSDDDDSDTDDDDDEGSGRQVGLPGVSPAAPLNGLPRAHAVDDDDDDEEDGEEDGNGKDPNFDEKQVDYDVGDNDSDDSSDSDDSDEDDEGDEDKDKVEDELKVAGSEEDEDDRAVADGVWGTMFGFDHPGGAAHHSNVSTARALQMAKTASSHLKRALQRRPDSDMYAACLAQCLVLCAKLAETTGEDLDTADDTADAAYRAHMAQLDAEATLFHLAHPTAQSTAEPGDDSVQPPSITALELWLHWLQRHSSGEVVAIAQATADLLRADNASERGFQTLRALVPLLHGGTLSTSLSQQSGGAGCGGGVRGREGAGGDALRPSQGPLSVTTLSATACPPPAVPSSTRGATLPTYQLAAIEAAATALPLREVLSLAACRVEVRQRDVRAWRLLAYTLMQAAQVVGSGMDVLEHHTHAQELAEGVSSWWRACFDWWPEGCFEVHRAPTLQTAVASTATAASEIAGGTATISVPGGADEKELWAARQQSLDWLLLVLSLHGTQSQALALSTEMTMRAVLTLPRGATSLPEP